MVIRVVSTFSAIMNNTALKIHMQVFVDVCSLVSVDYSYTLVLNGKLTKLSFSIYIIIRRLSLTHHFIRKAIAP